MNFFLNKVVFIEGIKKIELVCQMANSKNNVVYVIFISAHLKSAHMKAHLANFFSHHRHFRKKIGNLLCMHKICTEYRFELWSILLKIMFF